MRTLSRRSFVRSAAAAGAVFAAPSILKANNPVWGDVPAGVWAPGTTPSSNIKMLEIHLLGGMAPFESFYYRDAVGSRTRGFDTEIQSLNWNGLCPSTPAGLASQFLANDTMAKPINLGPFAKPLWPAHISSKTRVCVLSHGFKPHEVAIPYIMTGSQIGRPNQATLGAAIQHRYRALDADAGSPVRPVPYAYGLLPTNTFFDQLVFGLLGTIGTHPGSAKPLTLRIGAQFGSFIQQLDRPIGTSSNALLDQYRAQYRDWLRYQGSVDPANIARSKAFFDYDAAVANLFDSASLSGLLTPAPSTINNSASCASEINSFSNVPNPTATALKTAAYLLTKPGNEQARHVHVIDSGVLRTSLPYDVHNAGHATDTGSNLWNTLTTLASLIKDPANPTPQDATKLDLNETIIVINTDFGRTPFKSSGDAVNLASKGRDHWPFAFCSVIIGGPITTQGVVGSILDGTGLNVVADASYTPTDLRAALLVAMNINPFEAENFALGALSSDFSTAMDHTQAMIKLRQKILGVS